MGNASSHYAGAELNNENQRPALPPQEEAHRLAGVPLLEYRIFDEVGDEVDEEDDDGYDCWQPEPDDMPSLTPRTLSECVDKRGEINLDSYYLFCRNREVRENDEFDDWFQECVKEAEIEAVIDSTSNTRRRRRMKRDFMKYRNDNGDLVEYTSTKSNWYVRYVSSPNLENPSFHDKFRRRFRMPYRTFLELLELLKEDPKFARWQKPDAVGSMCSPIELMLLGALRYLGRGWTFDDVEEATAINEETHRQFFHAFVTWGSDTLFHKYVISPTTKEEADKNSQEFGKAGFHGCIGSSDATHVGMEKCSHWLKQAHLGAKLNMASRTYNMTVNHRRRILCTTKGHPARWNDKTLQLFDKLLTGIHDGSILGDVEFELLEYKGEADDAEVKVIKYKGVWLMVDNGYIHWPTCQPPYKHYTNYPQVRWSEWCESMRKDVECTFGILKGRFRILKAGVRLHGVETTDKIWHTCCGIHNMLIEVDGLEEGWEAGALSPWETELGNHNPHDSDRNFALHRLMNPADFATLDRSGMGQGNDRNTTHTDDDADDAVVHHGRTYPRGSEGVRVVRELDFEYFRGRLVEHFDILFKRQEVSWPARHRQEEPVNHAAENDNDSNMNNNNN
jgi:hypothetical protein